MGGRTAPPHGPEGWHQEGIPEDGQEEGCPQEEARRQEGQEARCQEGRQEACCQEGREEGCCQEVNSLILQTLLYLMLDQIRFKGNYYNVNTGVNYLIYKHCCFVLNKNPEKK